MADLYFSDVSLLLHLDGIDGSQTFIDSGPGAKGVTFLGAPYITNLHSQFGGAANFDGAVDSLVVTGGSTDAAFKFGTGDFTVECFARWDSTASGNTTLLSRYGVDVGNRSWAIQRDSATGQIRVLINSTLYTTANGVASNIWQHIALVRASGVVNLYVDGVSFLTASVPASIDAGDIVEVRIGAHVNASARHKGHIDEVRITKGVARYTADFSPPLVAFEGGPSIATANLTCPPPTLLAGKSSEVIVANLTAPSPTLLTFSGSHVYFTPPSPSLTFTGHDSTGERAVNLTAPSPTLTIRTGANAALTAPNTVLTVAAAFVGWGSAQLAPRVSTLTATGKVSAVASAALTAPVGRAAGYFGSVISVAVSGTPSVAATGTTGALGRAEITAPLFDLSIRATAQNHGSAVLAAPTGRLATTGAAWLVAPGATLTAIGTAVVAVSYEAYALNLNHRNPDSPDELTRYTNYPFDRIVRYENSYFGMNATGLYLLEGTTDFAEPTPTKVPWRFKTGLTDFDSPNLKTVNWAYFGGRMAPAATISIHYGDTGEQNYAYSTPRGAEAQNYRQPFGRGIKSRYYAVEAEGSGALSIDSMMFDIASMARKV